MLCSEATLSCSLLIQRLKENTVHNIHIRHLSIHRQQHTHMQGILLKGLFCCLSVFLYQYCCWSFLPNSFLSVIRGSSHIRSSDRHIKGYCGSEENMCAPMHTQGPDCHDRHKDG